MANKEMKTWTAKISSLSLKNRRAFVIFDIEKASSNVLGLGSLRLHTHYSSYILYAFDWIQVISAIELFYFANIVILYNVIVFYALSLQKNPDDPIAFDTGYFTLAVVNVWCLVSHSGYVLIAYCGRSQFQLSVSIYLQLIQCSQILGSLVVCDLQLFQPFPTSNITWPNCI